MVGAGEKLLAVQVHLLILGAAGTAADDERLSPYVTALLESERPYPCRLRARIDAGVGAHHRESEPPETPGRFSAATFGGP